MKRSKLLAPQPSSPAAVAEPLGKLKRAVGKAVRRARRIARTFTEFQVLTAAMFIAAATYALFPFVASAGALMVLSFALGLALGSAQPMVMALLHSIAPAGRMGEAFRIQRGPDQPVSGDRGTDAHGRPRQRHHHP